MPQDSFSDSDDGVSCRNFMLRIFDNQLSKDAAKTYLIHILPWFTPNLFDSEFVIFLELLSPNLPKAEDPGMFLWKVFQNCRALA